MKSIKPGRGPSGMGAFSAVCAAIFGVFWCIVAASMGAFFMIPFGIIFIVICIANAVYNHKNATGKNRYSEFDIVDENEEEDPLNARYGEKRETGANQTYTGGKNFCPYCGTKSEGDHKFCGNCGKRLE